MTVLVWQPELNTGIDVIDQQHQRIVALINQLADAHTREDQAYAKHVRHDLETCRRGASGASARDGWFKRKVKRWLQ